MVKFSAVLIGCGDIGYLFDRDKKCKGALTHFKAFRDSGKFNLIAVSEIREEIREEIQSKYGIPAFGDYKKMLKEIKPDVIAIASDDETHYPMLCESLKCKPKLVFIEKPLALKYEEVKNVIKNFKKEKILLQVNYTRRFLKEFDEAGTFIKSGKIGKPESAVLYYSRGLTHNASHYIDLMNSYIGETEKNLIKISEKKGIGDADSTVSFDLIYKNGFEMRFIGLNPTKLAFAEIDIAGTSGRVRINCNNEIEYYKVRENRLFKGYYSYELFKSVVIDFTKALPNAVENIYSALCGKEKLKSSGENSLKIFELIKRIREKELCRN